VIGTRRILGAIEQGDMATKPLPANVARLMNGPQNPYAISLYGDFKICAWKPQRAGEMQMVRIVGGRHLIKVLR
jgi:hypothetical protein